MAWRVAVVKKCLIGALSICFIVAIYLGTTRLPASSVRRSRDTQQENGNIFTEANRIGYQSLNGQTDKVKIPLTYLSDHHLAVIVPFRDRFEELLIFAPFIHRFLNERRISHDIIVVNQADTYRFNRAALINVGFNYALSSLTAKKCDYIAMHDVDLLPLNKELPYNYPDEGSVMHVAGPGLHPKYNYPSFIGGILLVTVSDFKKVNGMSNIYWGWGMEDDEFYVRLKQNNIQVKRPTGLDTGMKDTFRHIHSAKIRPRDTTKCFDQFNKTRRRDRETGLKNIDYTFVSLSNLTIDEAPVVVVNIKLHCNTQISPWCDCGQNNKNKTSSTAQNINKAKVGKNKKTKKVSK